MHLSVARNITAEYFQLVAKKVLEASFEDLA